MTKPPGCLSNLRDCEQLCDNCLETNRRVQEVIQHEIVGPARQKSIDEAIALLTRLGYQVLSPQQVQQNATSSWASNPDRSGGQFTQDEISESQRWR
jgi:hypothetical protein